MSRPAATLTTVLLNLLLALTLTTAPAFADPTKKLVGKWKGSKITLHLRANKTYSYKMKVLSFSGTWSASKSILTLNYRIAGIKKKRTANYRLKKGSLILSQKGKKDVILKRQ